MLTLKDAGLLVSTGSTGDSCDNAMAESINGLYKAEVIHRKSWKTSSEVELATLEGTTTADCWSVSDIPPGGSRTGILCLTTTESAGHRLN